MKHHHLGSMEKSKFRTAVAHRFEPSERDGEKCAVCDQLRGAHQVTDFQPMDGQPHLVSVDELGRVEL